MADLPALPKEVYIASLSVNDIYDAIVTVEYELGERRLTAMISLPRTGVATVGDLRRIVCEDLTKTIAIEDRFKVVREVVGKMLPIPE